MIDLRDDIILANNVRKNAYIKHNKYSVGAVLMTKNGKRYTGCNVQNHGIMSICAERTAFVKALSEGNKDFKIYTVFDNKVQEYTLEELLPHSFSLDI